MSNLQGYEALQRRLNAIGGASVAVPQGLGVATVREAKLLVPRRTGNLGRTIHVDSVTKDRVIVSASANYAGYVERGTRPHVIFPKNKKALRFAASTSGRRLSGTPRKGAVVVFAKRVNHPGTRPHPFLLPGAQKAVEKAGITDVVVKLWNSAA